MQPGTYPLVCSADDFHMADGTYKFDPKNIGKAHDYCLSKYLANFLPDAPFYNTIIVDNTNLTAWEIAPYYRLAEMHQHAVRIVRVYCDFEKAVRRGVHNVPPAKVWQMWLTLCNEKLPAHWNEEIVFTE